MAAFLDVCRFTPTAGSTTDWTVSAAATGYQTPAGAGAVNGALYRYRAESADLTQWEVGYGAYTVSGTVLARTTVLFNSAGTTAKINFSAAPTVAIVALAEDLSVPFTPQGRLTLATATPVMTTTQSAKTAIFYTNYIGNKVPIYDGVYWVPTDITSGEITVATTDSTKNPAAIGASKVNDWFVWNDAGTVRLSHGPDWTNDTTRAAGTALVMVNGIYLNNVSITNGPAASRGTYVGTTRSNGSSQLDCIFGGASIAAFFGVWNMYNRVTAATSVTENGGSHNYTSATVRQQNAITSNQITFVVGAVEDGATANMVGQVNTTNVANAVGYFGAGLNSTSSFTHGRNLVQAVGGVITQMGSTHSAAMMPALGVNVISANEAGDGANSNGFNASSLNVLGASLRL